MAETDEEWTEEEWAEVARQQLPTARAAAVVGLLGVGSLPGMRTSNTPIQ